MKNLIFLLFPIVLFSCAGGGDSFDKKLEQLTASDDMSELDAVKSELLNWTGEPAELGTKSRKLATYLLNNGKERDAIELMQNCLKNHLETAGTGENAELLAKIYEKSNQTRIASLIRQSVDEHPKESVTPISEQVRAIGKSIFADAQKGFDRQTAAEFVVAVENYAMLHPKDSLSPIFLIDAATIARNLGSPTKTLELFQWVYSKFPNHPKAAESMFYEAFTYDSDLKNFEKAEAAYKAFMQKHPDHPFVEQAGVMLANLGKTDEELLEAISKQQ